MEKLLSTVEAAAQLGVRPNTLEVWRHQRKGPKYKKLGRRVLYAPSDLEEYSASCTVDTTTRFYQPKRPDKGGKN